MQVKVAATAMSKFYYLIEILLVATYIYYREQDCIPGKNSGNPRHTYIYIIKIFIVSLIILDSDIPLQNYNFYVDPGEFPSTETIWVQHFNILDQDPIKFDPIVNSNYRVSDSVV